MRRDFIRRGLFRFRGLGLILFRNCDGFNDLDNAIGHNFLVLFRLRGWFILGLVRGFDGFRDRDFLDPGAISAFPIQRFRGPQKPFIGIMNPSDALTLPLFQIRNDVFQIRLG